MGSKNKIRYNVNNPLTDEESEFFIEPEKRLSYLRKAMKNEMKNNPLFKKAKYVVVVKHSESKNVYRLMGTRRKTRNYGIAILTDDNRFYFNQYQTKSTTFSKMNSTDLCRIFCQGYIWTNETKVIVSSDISDYSEPVLMFLKIVSAATGVPISRKTVPQMMEAANFFSPTPIATRLTKKKKQLGAWNRQTIIERLKAEGRFDFLPHDILDELRITVKGRPERRRRDLIFACSMGILYLFKKDLTLNPNKKYYPISWYNNQ